VANGWNLDPRVDGPGVYTAQGVPEGVGNQVSLEFNLLYRWHSTVSERDDKWTQEFSATIFPGKNVSTMSLAEFQQGLLAWTATIPPDPAKRELDMGKLKRQADGTFNDAALIKILNESTEDCAGRSSFALI
jgi:linoleate 10R-lipoxygenase